MRAHPVGAVGAFLQIPVFLPLFLAPVYVPLDLLQGWLGAVSPSNPATPILEAGRGFVSGVPDHTAVAFAVAVGMVALLALYARLGLRRAEASG